MNIHRLGYATLINAWFSISAIAAPAIARLELIDADKDTVIRQLNSQDSLNLVALPTRNINISAVASGVGSVEFKLDGKVVRTENGSPYALASDVKGNYNAWTPSLGTHTVTVTPYSLPNRGGKAGPSYSASFVVTNLAMGRLTLINALTEKALQVLTTGATLDLNQLPTDQLSIDAVVGSGTAGSVKFDLDRGAFTHVENEAPYGINGASTTDYFSWTPSPGSHTLTVTPFVGRDATGIAGVASTITFQVVAKVAYPPSAIILSPGMDLQAAINAAPTNSFFYLKAGVYRQQSLTPKDGSTFVGETGAVLAGARLLTSRAAPVAIPKVGNAWVWTAPAQLRAGQIHGQCISLAKCIAAGNCNTPTDPKTDINTTRYARCSYGEDAYLDGKRLWHAHSLAELKPGRYFVQYEATNNPAINYVRTVYFADDPNGRDVELATTRNAFNGTAKDVTIRNLTIEKYATPAQHGAIQADSTTGWKVEGNLVRYNHGVGIRVGSSMLVAKNRVLENGQIGIGGGGVSSVVSQNEIAGNNTRGFEEGWEAGGTKFAQSKFLTVKCNYSHDNDGPGLWTDISNSDTEYDRNIVVDNSSMGIFHEISFAAKIHDNIVKRNSKGRTAWLYGAQILSSTSSNVEIYDNYVEVAAEGGNGIGVIQQDRCSCARSSDPATCTRNCIWMSRNNYVHDNVIVNRNKGRTGAAADFEKAAFWQPGNVRFDRNEYHVPNLNSNFWEWSNGNRNWTSIRNAGAEVGGRADILVTENLNQQKEAVPDCN